MQGSVRDCLPTLLLENRMKFELGSFLKDTLTGFEGRVTARVEYLYDANRYYLESCVGQNGSQEPLAKWVNEDRLVFVDSECPPAE